MPPDSANDGANLLFTLAEVADRRAALPTGRLVEVPEFGDNPGNLRLHVYLPRRLSQRAPVVVVAHGCQQSAAAYDQGAGWSHLAERWGFALIFPEQKRENNSQGCFNWFDPSQVRRDGGEVASVRTMVAWALDAVDGDPARVFATGLSAGGALTAALLATYPEVFAAGAVLGGLPYRCASSVSEALGCMYQGRRLPPAEWGDLVRDASDHTGVWPRVSIWHGTRDTTVRATNAEELAKQWTDVHGLAIGAFEEEMVSGYPRRFWRGSDGAVLVESYEITGMAHGLPIHAGEEEHQVGRPGAFMFDVSIASTYHIGKFWGLDQPPPPPEPGGTTETETPPAEPAATVKPTRAKKTARPAKAATSAPSPVPAPEPAGLEPPAADEAPPEPEPMP
ncbi:MAG TPA: PHB depolymerase family esterase, partial [Azospirillaceae bacterium]|nr:PHB depolymerase family esterase [Azospirillaceae bacterium]